MSYDIMIKITRELFQKLFDEYKGLMMLSRILAVGCPLLGFLFIYILDSTLSFSERNVSEGTFKDAICKFNSPITIGTLVSKCG